MTWYQRDSSQSKDLKRPRNEMLQMDMDQFGPSVSKRAKIVQVPKTQTAYSPSWHGLNNSGEGSLLFSDSDHDNSTLRTVTNLTSSLVLSPQQQQQSAGQQSSERIFQANPRQESHVGYQGMNVLLGSLHLSRRRQKASEAGVHQHSAQHIESSIGSHHAQCEGSQKKPEWQPPRPQSPRKKVVSLRIDSNLY